MKAKRTPYIYIIAAEGSDGYLAFKIGKTSKYERARDHAGVDVATDRMASMQVGCPLPLRLIGTLRADHFADVLGWRHQPTHNDTSGESGSYAEGFLHAWLADERIRGEWFCGPKTIDLCEVLRNHKKKSETSVLCDLVDYFRKTKDTNSPQETAEIIRQRFGS